MKPARTHFHLPRVDIAKYRIPDSFTYFTGLDRTTELIRQRIAFVLAAIADRAGNLWDYENPPISSIRYFSACQCRPRSGKRGAMNKDVLHKIILENGL